MAGDESLEGGRSGSVDAGFQTKWSGCQRTFTSPDGEAATIQGGKLVDASLTFSFLYATGIWMYRVRS